MKKHKHLPPSSELGEPKRKFEDTFSAEGVFVDWMKEQGASAADAFDEDTGIPARIFTIKL